MSVMMVMERKLNIIFLFRFSFSLKICNFAFLSKVEEMSYIFSFDISLCVWMLLGAAAVLAVIYVLWQWNRTRTLTRFVERYEQERDYVEELPAVSVVVDAMNETNQLSRFLPLVLHQDYPCMEVIVVVDSSAEATSDMLSEMKSRFPNLRITFVPYGSRSLSRKKLAIMIGIKAAQYDIVLTTSANCRPVSDQWLKAMMRNFTPGTDIVLGYSHYRYHRDKRLGRFMRIFDTVTTGVQWLVSAIGGRPFRGTSDNMAYRKQLFFANRGFSNNMDLKWGEDDVFLSEITTTSNTRVELAPESQLAVYYEFLPHAHALLKMRRDFTSRLVRRTPFVVQGVMSLVYWLRLACLVAAVVMAPLNGVVLLLAVLLLILTWIPIVLLFDKNCRTLQAPPLYISVPVLTLWRPIHNAMYRLREMGNKKSNYTSFYD